MKEQFLRDVANHQMEIRLDYGVHRNVAFENPVSWSFRFELTTWPGHLAITGDMGTYIFARTKDMFRFFRGNENPNLDYWSEKVQAGASRGVEGVKEFSYTNFQKRVIELLRDADLDYLPGGSRAKIFRALRQDVISPLDDCPTNEEAHKLLSRFEYDGDIVFSDTCELDFTEFTFHFQWCCWAILWGIERYDKAKDDLQQVAFRSGVATP